MRARDPGLLEEGIVILRDEQGYWRTSIGEYWLGNVGDDPLVIRGGCRDQGLLSLVRRFVAGESGDLLAAERSEQSSRESTKTGAGTLACGSIPVAIESGSVQIRYREHESRNGRLRVTVDGHPLAPEELIRLGQDLQARSQTLLALRAKAAGLLLTVLSLQGDDVPQ